MSFVPVFERSPDDTTRKPSAGRAPDADTERLVLSAGLVIGVVATAIALLVLLGWLFDLAPLKSVFPAAVSLKPNSALCFLLVGIALLLAHPRWPRVRWRVLRRLSAGVAAVATLIPAVTLAQYLTGTDFGIDRLLFPTVIDDGRHPLRMAVATGAGLMTLGVALILLDVRGRFRIGQAFAVLGALLGLIALLGYLFGASALYQFFPYGAVSIHAAVLMVLCAAGILALRPGVGLMAELTGALAGSLMARKLLPVAVVVPIVVGWIRLMGQRQGWYGTEVGLALYATANVLGLTAAIWLGARFLNRADRATRAAEAALRQREAQLQDSQRLEAVGRLAGGIAHDFNNLINITNGYAELLLRRFSQDPAARRDLEAIIVAGDRAAAVTRQLLAFSRRQILHPEITDLNVVVTELGKLLRPLITEDIELVIHLDPEIGRVKVDRAQIEQVVMNLAVNARDAMPSGGKLILTTSSAELDASYASTHPETKPGRYVVLSVTDTGEGMDAETRAKIFEPFFTTKPTGKGTGLGLATVYGIVRQSEGAIWVYSEPGHGTTFKIYLPLESTESTATPLRPIGEEPGGSETILLAEDEPALRELAERVLRDAGYRVLAAANGSEALALAERFRDPIHLLVSDVVMAKVGGPELARRLKESRPTVRVLLMTGYSEDVVSARGLDPGTEILAKPFDAASLRRKVRQVLDGAA